MRSNPEIKRERRGKILKGCCLLTGDNGKVRMNILFVKYFLIGAVVIAVFTYMNDRR